MSNPEWTDPLDWEDLCPICGERDCGGGHEDTRGKMQPIRSNFPADQSTVGNAGGNDVDRSAVRALGLERAERPLEVAREQTVVLTPEASHSPPNNFRLTQSDVDCLADTRVERVVERARQEGREL